MDVPDDGVKASGISEVHDKVVIHGMSCENQVQSRKGPVGLLWLLYLTGIDTWEMVPTWGPQPE